MRPGRLLAAIVVACGFATPAAAACTQATTLETELPVNGDPCVAGVVRAGEQPALHWTVAEGGLWRISLEALPGAAGAIAIVGANGDALWQAVLQGGDGVVQSPELFLAAGRYNLLLTTAADMMIYRLELEPAGAAPPGLPTQLAGAFEGTVVGGDTRIDLTWDLATARPGELWTFEAIASGTRPGSFELYSPDGALLLYTSSPDEAGVLRLPDLQLAAGQYHLNLSGAAAGEAVLVRAYAETQPSTFAFEPDDTAARAHPIAIGVPATGRLATSGTFAEGDQFYLDVPADAGVRRYDIVLSAPVDADLTLAIVDADGASLLQRTDRRMVALRDLVLGPGHHLIRVSGSLPTDVTYALGLEDAGAPSTGVEVEPNDDRGAATAIADLQLIAGTFAGEDRDYIALGVTGGLQLWTIEVTGEGLRQLTLEDGAGETIATAAPEMDSPVVRVSRVLLPPGNNVIRIDGGDGNWLLRAIPLGPPADNVEIEPNDEPERALVLPPGVVQTGWLDRTDDPDLYTFHLDAPHRVALTLDAPADFPVGMNIAWGGRNAWIAQSGTRGPEGAPQNLSWQGLLLPGDYIVELRPVVGVSHDPYTLALTFPSFFDRPLDLEPNDEPWQAKFVAAGMAIEGDIYGTEVDWFELDPAFGPGTVTLRAEAIEEYLYLRVAHGDPAAPETLQDLYVYQTGETATLDLPAGERIFLQIGGGAGHYVLALGDQRPVEPVPVEARLTLEPTPVAAFETIGQTITGTLRLESSAKGPLTVQLSAWLGDERWRMEGVPEEITIAPGGEANYEVTILVPADVPDGLVPTEIGVSERDHSFVATRATVTVATGVSPVSPHRFDPYPSGMLGGLNVAWTALGGTVDDPTFVNLIDGIVDASGVALWPDYLPVLRLAGNGVPVPIAGVILHLPPDNAPAERLADFAIEVSVDGNAFRRVLEARLSPIAREQAFAFAAPVEAAVVRLVPLSAQGGPTITAPRLAELEVIADPSFALEPDGFNIALPARGGHVIRTVGTGDQDLTGENVLWPAEYYGVPISREGDGPIAFVFGFLEGRAARITSLRWNEAADTPPEERITEVAVEASVGGPFGPWTSLGTWRVADDPEFALAGTPWIRSLRFSVITPAAGRVWLPANIEVHEAPGPSILGAWGDLAPTGPYEAQQPLGTGQAVATVGTDRDNPTTLALGETAAGRVARGQVENWYEVELPEGTRTLRADFGNGLTPDVAVALVSPDGREVALQPDPRAPGILVAEATPGLWRLRVTQPVASVAVTWDTSLSVSAYYPAIARMIRRIGWQLDPEREAINLLPFRGEVSQFLMEHWSGDPAAIYAALHAYPLLDTSSDAENALLYAALRLNERVGSRAIVIATDASYSGIHLNEPLWQALEQGGIRVFALHFPVDFDPTRARAQINLMEDWANAAGGHMSRFASQGDGELAFRRLAAWLDRPADYSFVLAADTAPPEPGTLTVRLAEPVAGAVDPGAPAAAGRAMAIILDASGSMLQRLGDARRIDIAKDVLRELGRSILPEGMPVALRVFGHDQPGSCENALFLPLGPLDREAFVAAVDRVQSVNLARTSIAATLQAAAGDLAGVDGPKTIVLVTDGEETCGGDPLAVIRDLRASGIDVRLNIVGFAIDAAETRQMFEEWAEAGAGAYFDAGDAGALAAAVTQATALPFVVLDLAGNEVARGAVGGGAIPLPAGAYRLRVGDATETQEIAIRPGEAAEVAVGAPPTVSAPVATPAPPPAK